MALSRLKPLIRAPDENACTVGYLGHNFWMTVLHFLLQIVEHFLTKNGFSYKWEPSGTLIYWNVLPAFQQHPKTGETMWFNQIQGHHASALKDNPR